LKWKAEEEKKVFFFLLISKSKKENFQSLRTSQFRVTAFSSRAGLPDGIFSNQKSQFGKILEGLAMELVGLFDSHLVYSSAIWCMLWSFGMLL
jgi:hypothetical protein